MAWSIGIAKIIIIKEIVAPKIRLKKFWDFEKPAPDLLVSFAAVIRVVT